MTIVVNLFGGPGTGKSTTAAATFAELKYRGINTELVTEYAKDKVWEQSTNILGNQVYLLGKQYHRLWRLDRQVDVIVTDSPLLLLLEYGRAWGPKFADLAVELHHSFSNFNVMLRRPLDKVFNPKGRLQTSAEALDLDLAFEAMLDRLDIYYESVLADRDAPLRICELLTGMKDERDL